MYGENIAPAFINYNYNYNYNAEIVYFTNTELEELENGVKVNGYISIKSPCLYNNVGKPNLLVFVFKMHP